MVIKLDVTQEEIDKGIPCNYFKCPIALALKKAIKDIPNWPYLVFSIESYNIRLYEPNGQIIIKVKLPEEIVNFIKDFDHSKARNLKPTVFEIEIPL